jgi:CheY-like chemotaxis protein
MNSLDNNMVKFKFTVKDTGIGIPEDKQNELFERFSQLDCSYKKKYQGTGLGLAISKRLVELMGGEIWIESQEGPGSCFNFTLVAKIYNENEKMDNNTQVIGKLAEDAVNKRILIVEDDEVNRYFISKLLSKNQWETVTAENGAEALSILKRERFDLILMDIQMPVLDGFSATKSIREDEEGRGRHTKIIAMTAYALKDDRDKCLENGMDDYISKPIDINEFYEVINKWV